MKTSRIIAVVIAASTAITTTATVAAAVPLKPHLVPLLPTAVSANQHAPVFMDPFARPGHLLYRFDAVLWNQGGAVDMFSTSPSSATTKNVVKQVLWDNGLPSTVPADPNADPSTDPRGVVEDRTAAQPSMTILFDSEAGHHHWHFLQAAEYTLLIPHRPARGSGKEVGFCLVDSYGPIEAGAPSFFPQRYTGSLTDPGRSWCQYFQSPLEGGVDPPVVRMGISPGWGDIYQSQDAGQWIDVTGLKPGPYTLTNTANPVGFIDASPPVDGDNVRKEQRLIPGVTVRGLARSVSGAGSRIGLSGKIVAPEIPARVSRKGRCTDENLSPTTPLPACYRIAKAAGPLRFAIVKRPKHGTVRLVGTRGLTSTAIYTPGAGSAGRDSFTYKATDARGLSSTPATVTLR